MTTSVPADATDDRHDTGGGGDADGADIDDAELYASATASTAVVAVTARRAPDRRCPSAT